MTEVVIKFTEVVGEYTEVCGYSKFPVNFILI